MPKNLGDTRVAVYPKLRTNRSGTPAKTEKLSDILTGIKSGKYNDQKLKAVRALREKMDAHPDDPVYKAKYKKAKERLMVFLLARSDSGYNNLFPIDNETGSPTKEGVLSRFKSAGYKGWCEIIAVDGDFPDKESYAKAARALDAYLQVPTNKGQASYDRVRYVSYDPDIFIDYKVKPIKLPPGLLLSDEKKSFDINDYVPLNNQTALSVFSHYRKGAGLPLSEVKVLMRGLKRDSDSLATDKDLDDYIDKWERAYITDSLPGSDGDASTDKTSWHTKITSAIDSLPGKPASAVFDLIGKLYPKDPAPSLQAITALMEHKRLNSFIQYNPLLDESDPVDDEFLVYLEDDLGNSFPMCTRGNHTLVNGKRKARKTLLMVYLASLTDGLRISVFDTEQGATRAKKYRDKIRDILAANKKRGKVDGYDLRQLSEYDRRETIMAAVREHRYDLVIIDGVRELVRDINSPEEASVVLEWLWQLLSINVGTEGNVKNCHVINILHQNKGNMNSRGHLGTELENKSELTISVTTEGDFSVVRSEFSRDQSFPPFTLQHDTVGLPQVGWELPDSVKIEKKKLAPAYQPVLDILSTGPRSRKDLLEELVSNGRNESTAESHIARAIKDGLVVKTSRGIYSLKQ